MRTHAIAVSLLVGVAVLAPAGRHGGGYEPVTLAPPYVLTPNSFSPALLYAQLHEELDHPQHYRVKNLARLRRRLRLLQKRHYWERTVGRLLLPLDVDATISFKWNANLARVTHIVFWTDAFTQGEVWSNKGSEYHELQGLDRSTPIPGLVDVKSAPSANYTWISKRDANHVGPRPRYGFADLKPNVTSLDLHFLVKSPANTVFDPRRSEVLFHFALLADDENGHPYVVATDSRVISILDSTVSNHMVIEPITTWP